MPDKQSVAPESTALRVALWRAMHTEVDAPPYVLEDDIGLQLIAPDEDWRDRPDMHPQGTRGFRASVVGRARFIEDLVAERADRGIAQYVLLGAGLDTFAQRRPGLASRLQVFEVDQPGPQAWKRQRLISLGFGVPEWLHLVPVDFEASDSWLEKLAAAGFATDEPAVVASTGVTMYLSLDAINATLRQIASLARGTTLAMTFLLPPELVEPADRAIYEAVLSRARDSGTPFVSLFSPAEILALASEAGFSEARCVLPADLAQRYFSERTDGFRPVDGEVFLVATV
ncbi:class I SAM-dependent methyltransferase [Burkholderia ubonensis]|uniref:class I SAM-dependent methyltransferase n=1 Tax=Burkholderia ubonensis TaxID=101571 RepID=UPI00075BC1E5|nr:class I SAM-dependent methyltransferase [Burkholderia ubonensis]KVQ72772.1 methyltransferase [Burkholderia ubonensis]KWD31505.1 methyltransferase [Burkholderia ubonensis]KWD34610.1 methyltransferase [Burkholderia ubonensis]KWO98257.1 methyltransferase [Burkholderia ubonensis]